jgi:hypothetical protein
MFLLLCNLNHSLIWVENVTFLQPSWYGKWLIILPALRRHGVMAIGNMAIMKP